jgi:hypothetical protein
MRSITVHVDIWNPVLVGLIDASHITDTSQKIEIYLYTTYR